MRRADRRDVLTCSRTDPERGRRSRVGSRGRSPPRSAGGCSICSAPNRKTSSPTCLRARAASLERGTCSRGVRCDAAVRDDLCHLLAGRSGAEGGAHVAVVPDRGDDVDRGARAGARAGHGCHVGAGGAAGAGAVVPGRVRFGAGCVVAHAVRARLDRMLRRPRALRAARGGSVFRGLCERERYGCQRGAFSGKSARRISISSATFGRRTRRSRRRSGCGQRRPTSRVGAG